MREAIERRIQEFLGDLNLGIAWVKPAVRGHGFLPLHFGWVAIIGIRPDGSFVRWDYEGDPTVVKALSDPWSERMAICQGAKKYPELAALLPPRPPKARECNSCRGNGTIDALPQVICRCGGVGWVVPGEAGPLRGIG